MQFHIVKLVSQSVKSHAVYLHIKVVKSSCKVKLVKTNLVEAVKWTSPEDHFKSCGGQSYSLWTNVSEFRK